jgi:hypothetical protein
MGRYNGSTGGCNGGLGGYLGDDDRYQGDFDDGFYYQAQGFQGGLYREFRSGIDDSYSG